MGYACTHIFEISSKWIFLHIRWQKDNLQRKTKFRENMIPWQPSEAWQSLLPQVWKCHEISTKEIILKKKKKIRQWQKPNKSNRMLCLHKTAIKKVKYFNMKADITGFTAHFTFSYYHCYLFFIFFFQTKHICTSLSTSLHAPSLSLLEWWWTMAFKHAAPCGLHT